MKVIEKINKLAKDIIETWDSKMKWMWGEALLGYALSLLDEHQHTDEFTPFLKGYCDYYVANPPRVDQSDTSAPGLITYYMWKITNNEAYKKLTDRVIHYIMKEPRLIEDSVNHLGNSLEGKFYPIASALTKRPTRVMKGGKAVRTSWVRAASKARGLLR